MLGISRYLTFTVAAAALLVEPALAQAHSPHAHRGSCRYEARAALLQDIANSPFYGPFGGYYDASAAARYSGPNERHYFGYGSGARFDWGWDWL